MLKRRGERYEKVFANIYSSSFRYSMIAISVVAILELFMLFYTVMNPELYGPLIWRYRGFYISLLAAALIYIALNLYAMKDIDRRYRLLNIANPLYVMFFFAWALGVTYHDYTVLHMVDLTVFMTFSLIVPLGFYVLPEVYGIIVIVADALMMAMIIHAAGGIGQLINGGIFIIFQLVLGVSFLALKTQLAERIVEERRNANIDALTGCGNRRAYNSALERGVGQRGLSYVAIDINGLKEVNDTCGHDEGDRLIVGEAQCVERAFGKKARVFRTGGDEFAVLTPERDVEALLAACEKGMQEWSAANGMELSASCGYARSIDHPSATITELARIADRNMLQAKAAYYAQSGRERRRQA